MRPRLWGLAKNSDGPWVFCIEIPNNSNNLKSIHQSAILKAHCWDKNMNNVVPDIPLCIREGNAMQTGCYFSCPRRKEFV